MTPRPPQRGNHTRQFERRQGPKTMKVEMVDRFVDRGDGVHWAALRVEAARKAMLVFQSIADRDRDAGRQPSVLLMDRLVALGLRLAEAQADLDRVRAYAKVMPAYVDPDDLMADDESPEAESPAIVKDEP